MKLSEIAETLRQIRVTPIKTLGQNFLHDQNLARWIVAKAELRPHDYVVEIGPGLGALTEHILVSGAYVLAIEKDARLVQFLRERFSNERFEVMHADALQFDVRRLFAKGKVKLLANLPYYVSTQLIMRFIDPPSPIAFALLMLQKEVARRLAASPGTEDHGILTLMVQVHCRVEYLKTVSATAFLPQPEVDSAFVRLTPRDPAELPEYDAETFSALVRQGFSQRRKQLGKLIRSDLPTWDEAAPQLGINLKARAEDLSLEQWIALANLLHPSSPPMSSFCLQERFAIVNEEDDVIDEAGRAEVHGNNLLHRAVHLFIFNPARELFLQKRSRWKDRHPFLWDSSAAGHVNAGETYDETARRELMEELGISTKLERLLKLPASDKTGQEFIWLYRGQHGGPFQIARSEIEYGAFFPLNVIEEWIANRPHDFAPGFIECWSAFQPFRLTKPEPED